MSIESQIKRQIYAQPHTLLLFHPRGFGETCAAEVREALSALAMPDKLSPRVVLTEAGVKIEDVHYRSMLELALRLRTARDIYWVLGKGRAASVDEIKKRVLRVPWKLILPTAARIALRTSLRSSRMRHEGLVESAVADALESLGFSPAKKGSAQLLDIRLERNQLQFGLSIAGNEPLFHRHYKSELRGAASVKEDLAACLIRAAWQKNKRIPKHIFTPFAGSGTFGFESLLAMAPLPVTLWRRELACLEWLPSSKPTVAFIEKSLLAEAASLVPESLLFWERSPRACAELNGTIRSFIKSCEKRGLRLSSITAEESDFLAEASPPTADGGLFLPLNPPYGRRLKSGLIGPGLYRRIGERIESLSRQNTLSGFVLAPDQGCARAVSQELSSFRLQQGSCLHGGTEIKTIFFTDSD